MMVLLAQVEAGTRVSAIDLAVILVYMLGIMLIGIFSVRRLQITGDVYFLAGRSLRWPVVGAALFASNISTIHLVGLAQDGYQRGLVVGNFEWMASFTLILLALVFVPFYFRSQISTLPEFLEKRYDPLARSIMAVMAILSALLIHIGISLYAGAQVFDRFFGINVYLSIVIISLVTVIYTVVGGLRAVVVTETIQTVILLGGAILVTVLAVNRLPDANVRSWADFNRVIDVTQSAESLGQAADMLEGCQRLLQETPQQDESGQSVADLVWAQGTQIKESEKMSLVSAVLRKGGHESLAKLCEDPQQWGGVDSASGDFATAAADLRRAQEEVLENGDTSEYRSLAAESGPTPRLSMLRAEGPYAWLAILLGFPVLGVWYWCTDQTIVQRVLGAKDQQQAQTGALFAGLLKILPVFFMVLPGTIAFVIMRDEIGDQSAQTLPIMIAELMPVGLKGLMAAALLAALMSTIAAALNSVGTLMAKDIVGHFRPHTTDAEQIRIGRISAVVVMLVAMAWSTQGHRFGTIFEVINKIPALFLAPPITTVFVWGLFWPRGTKQAAVTTLILGLTVGFALFLVDSGAFGGVEWISNPRFGLGIPFLMQGFYLFCLWSVLYVVISLMTPAPPREQVESTTWSNPIQVLLHGKLTGMTDPRLLGGGLLVLMIFLYWFFR